MALIPPPIPPPSGPGNSTTTSNRTPWTMSAELILYDAYLDAKLIGEGDELNSEERAIGLRRLDKLINYLQTKGLKLWLQFDLAIPILADTPAYSLSGIFAAGGLYPKRVIQGYFQYYNSSQNRYPLIPLSWNELLTLGNVGVSGTITQYFVDKQSTDTVVTFWQQPSASVVLLGQPHLLVQNQILNYSVVNNQSLSPSFPPEWALTLEWGLAAQICSGQPQEVINRCEKMATFYQTELEDWDVEDASTSFQPDQRAILPSRFK